METILNVVWLGVTLAALWVWRFRWKGANRKPGHDVRLEAVAMICILALLFPVISLTDDLHPEVIPVDAASSKRALCLLTALHAHGNHSGAVSHPRLGLDSPVWPARVESDSFGRVAPTRVLSPLSRSATVLGRAPPSLA